MFSRKNPQINISRIFLERDQVWFGVWTLECVIALLGGAGWRCDARRPEVAHRGLQGHGDGHRRQHVGRRQPGPSVHQAVKIEAGEDIGGCLDGDALDRPEALWLDREAEGGRPLGGGARHLQRLLVRHVTLLAAALVTNG